MNYNIDYAGSGPAGEIRSQTFLRYALYFDASPAPVSEKLSDFAKYVPREALSRFLVKYEIFKRVLHVQGSVIECGVFNGAGLMTFAQISEMLEPLNHQRKIIGFDTWSGFPHVASEDGEAQEDNFSGASYDELRRGIELWNSTRYLKHIPKVALVRGDICETVPIFIEQNPETVISLLYLDADLYLPTKTALEYFVPRMPKGAIVAFDELNDCYWPGEAAAVLDTLGIRNLRIERSFATAISFAVLE